MIWYDCGMVYARNCKPATYSASVRVSSQHFQFPLWVFSVAIARPKSMSMGGFDFQRRSMKQSTFNWISQADPIDMIDTSLSVSGEKLNKAQCRPPVNIVSKSSIRWDNPSPNGCFASHLVKECGGVAKEKRRGRGELSVTAPKEKKRNKNNDCFSRSCQIAGIIINLGPNNNNNTCMQMNVVRKEAFYWTVLVLNVLTINSS